MIFLLIVVVGVVSIAAAPDRGSKTPDLIKQRLAVVEKVNEVIKAAIVSEEIGALDQQVSDWSVRTMDAERDAASDHVGHVAAVERHVTRKKKMETAAKQLLEAGDVNELDVANAQWNRLEAEGWLAEEKATKKRDQQTANRGHC